MREFLTPVRTVEPRPDPQTDETGATYVRSFLWLRVGIGALGVLLPVLLLVVDRVAFHGRPVPRDSMSAYYYSGMREAFVGVIFATAAFLAVYKIAEINLDNAASFGAGVCGAFIAFFPTGRPSLSDNPRPPRPPLNPLQDLIGEDWVKYVHYGASFGFIVLLTVLSVTFGIREGRRPRVPGKRSPTFWRYFHYTCAGAMSVAGLWILVTALSHTGPRWSLLLGEWACAWAFGLSWLWKGAELDMLFGNPPSRPVSSGAGDSAEAL